MTRKVAVLCITALAALAVLSCKEINRQNAPVLLVVNTQQTLNRIDVQPNAANCNQNIATVNISARIIQNSSGTLATNPDLDVVQLTEYRISYIRTDGGTLVPAPFTRAMTQTITPGGAGVQQTFIAFQVDALSQAPFAALLPQNGGKDPQTGRPVVQMDIVLEVFGTTLAGERVSASTRIPVDFCYQCGGCA